MVMTLSTSHPQEVECLYRKMSVDIKQSSRCTLTTLNSLFNYIKKASETAVHGYICAYRINSNVAVPLGVHCIIGTEVTLDVQRCYSIAERHDS